jgi:hypothetical protein
VSFFVFSPHRFLLLLLPVTAAVVIECEFKTTIWSNVESIYRCTPRVDPSITSPGVNVTSASGSHMPSMSHTDVKGFSSQSKTINFMPRGLNDVFPNLIGVSINDAGMKEIRQSDLKQFPRLRYLYLYKNAITIVERELFKFNPELEHIGLDDNKISQIHPTVFDHLNKLSELSLDLNVCINAYATGRSHVVNLLRSVKQECPGDFVQIDEEQSESVQQTELTTAKASLENLERTQGQYEGLRAYLNISMI